MIKLEFGKKNKLLFKSEEHFFEALGLLVASYEDKTAKFVVEHNELQGAWGYECRIQIFGKFEAFKRLFGNKVTAGVGNCLGRINCNDYFAYLESEMNFDYRNTVNKAEVEKKIPFEYQAIFEHGYNL